MTGFFGILKNISMLADDTVLVMKHTSSILGDDIAVISEKSSKFSASRELPVIWEITKGSLLNKIIILPLMFLLNYFMPNLITPVLLLGAMYLSLEGFEKINELTNRKSTKEENERIVKSKSLVDAEKEKIKSAIRMDFVLSIEVVLISLHSVLEKTLLEQTIIVTIISILATIGVYGIVALIIRLDDIGMWFVGRGKQTVGKFFVKAMAHIISSLSYIGAVAMLMVAGGIISSAMAIQYSPLLSSFALIQVLEYFGEILIAYIIGGLLYVAIEKSKKFKKKITS